MSSVRNNEEVMEGCRPRLGCDIIKKAPEPTEAARERKKFGKEEES